jgi:predicted nucleotidyltransferase
MKTVKNKLKLLVREISSRFKKELKSVILFGSGCYKRNPKDIDIIFIFKNGTSLDEIKKIKQIFNKHFPVESKKFSLIEEKLTIYRPPYFCYEKDFIDKNFRKIFFLTRFPLWSFFFFKSGYIKGLQENHKILYGIDYFSYWNNTEILVSEGIFSFLQEVFEFLFFLILYLVRKEKSEEYFQSMLKKLPLHLFILDKKEYPFKKELTFYIKKEYPWLERYIRTVKTKFNILILIIFLPVLLISILKSIKLLVQKYKVKFYFLASC